MKILPFVLCLAATASFVRASSSDEACECSAVAKPVKLLASADTAPKASAPQRHPLKGVVVDVLAERGSLLVKHEEVPGVMKAMTMLLKVDAAALKTVQKGQSVTGLLVRKPDGWWLEEVKAVSP